MGADPDPARVVLVAGATGLVGRECLRLLSAEPGVREIRALVRRPLVTRADSKVREVRADLDRLGEVADAFRVDAVFCALGTTIKKAGSQDAFRRVDFDFPLSVARAGLAGGARHFLLVSAMGASARSGVFYSRVKGELEDAILGLGYPSVTLARPSMLMGDREEPRRGEELARKLAWLVPARWAPVKAESVAAALVRAMRRRAPGVEILENAALRQAR